MVGDAEKYSRIRVCVSDRSFYTLISSRNRCCDVRIPSFSPSSRSNRSPSKKMMARTASTIPAALIWDCVLKTHPLFTPNMDIHCYLGPWRGIYSTRLHHAGLWQSSLPSPCRPRRCRKWSCSGPSGRGYVAKAFVLVGLCLLVISVNLGSARSHTVKHVPCILKAVPK